MKFKKITAYAVMVYIILMAGFLSPCFAETEDVKGSIEEVKKEFKDLVQALGSYTAEQRNEAIQKSGEALEDMDRVIEEIENRIAEDWNKMDKAARKKTRESFRELRKKRTEAAEWFGSLKYSSKEAWEELKKDFADVYKDLLDALQKSEEELGTVQEISRGEDKVAL